ncbi:hypothetical protein BDB00DRAFT_802751, partial [Zychaea mexicana]|uniref:uncharacterized protein n=1 Tax=Zychaea mexicana TaxID=64656 RepID=UPI0022FE1861
KKMMWHMLALYMYLSMSILPLTFLVPRTSSDDGVLSLPLSFDYYKLGSESSLAKATNAIINIMLEPTPLIPGSFAKLPKRAVLVAFSSSRFLYILEKDGLDLLCERMLV